MDKATCTDIQQWVAVDAANVLMPHATVCRYLGDLLEPSEEGSEEALKCAPKMVHEYVLERLPYVC